MGMFGEISWRAGAQAYIFRNVLWFGKVAGAYRYKMTFKDNIKIQKY